MYLIHLFLLIIEYFFCLNQRKRTMILAIVAVGNKNDCPQMTLYNLYSTGMQNLSIPTKKILLRLFIATIVLINFAVVLGIYFQTPQLPRSQTYSNNLLYQHKVFEAQRTRFNSYNFYQNYDTLVYNNSVFDYNYAEGLKEFANMSQQTFYKVMGVVRGIVDKKGFGEIAKYGYKYNDWTSKRVPIYNENGYNSSYIFAALTAIEYQINGNNSTDKWVSLSAQEIVDCCPECLKTKRPQSVFTYIKNSGISTQKSYPYRMSRFDREVAPCRAQEVGGQRYSIKGYRAVKGCSGLERELASGVVVVGFDARNFYSYEYGIFQQCQRKTTHYGLLIGINYNYWKVQNSWGGKWGERGYVRIGPADTCGICLRGSVPVLEQSR